MAQRIDEKTATGKVTLEDLRDGYYKVLKTFKVPDASTIRLDKRDVTTPRKREWRGTIKGSGTRHSMAIIVHPEGEDVKPSFTAHKCEVRCSCSSFRYDCASALYEAKALAGRPKEIWKKPIEDRKRNVNQIPMMCKHLVSFSEALGRAGDLADWYKK